MVAPVNLYLSAHSVGSSYPVEPVGRESHSVEISERKVERPAEYRQDTIGKAVKRDYRRQLPSTLGQFERKALLEHISRYKKDPRPVLATIPGILKS